MYLRSGTLTNSGTAARISSSLAGGIYIRGTVSAVVVNQGTISGRAYGVDTGKAGTVTNSGTAASIIGGFDGVDLAGTIASTLINEGTIAGTTNAGVHMTAGGVLRNTGVAASITGGKYGVRMFGTQHSTVINGGTISGGTDSVQFQNVNGNYLKLYPGAVENGAVNFGTGTGNVLALGSGAGTGAISASSFTGFATIDVAFGGIWALQGTIPLSAGPSRIGTINNSGTVVGGSASGLDIRTGGVVNNSNSISGGTAGVFLAGAHIELRNNGFINGTTYGVEFRAPGTFAGQVGTLTNSAYITGGQSGVYLYGGPSHLGVLRNSGSIIGAAANGVYDVAGSAVFNLSYSFISGATNGILATGAAATVTNYGTITGVAHDGVYFEAGGALLNRFGTITGGRRGVNLEGGPGKVTNGGTIVGLGSVGNSIGVGVYFQQGGTLSNNKVSAHISGAYGVALFDIFSKATTPDAVINQGTISGTTSIGVEFVGSGTLMNQGSAADISGNYAGVKIGAYTYGDAVTNQGTISGTNFGIIGANYGSPITIANQGTITGTTAAVRFADFSGNVFREFPGAAVNGAVKGGTLTDTLALAAGPAVGTISGISTQFTGFEVVQVDAGAGWRAVGANTLATSATLLSYGLLRVMGTLVAPTNLTMAGLGTLAAATTGQIEVGTAGTAHAGQIVVDAAHTLISSGALSARVILNRGTITGASDNGVQLVGAGAVTNSGTAALISGAQYGVYAPAGVANVFNQGKIIGSAGAGVYFGPGGTVTNSGIPALISGGQWGVESTGPAFVVNQGTITGASAGGVQLFAGGSGDEHRCRRADCRRRVWRRAGWPRVAAQSGYHHRNLDPEFRSLSPRWRRGNQQRHGRADLRQTSWRRDWHEPGNCRQLWHNHRLIDLRRGH